MKIGFEKSSDNLHAPCMMWHLIDIIYYFEIHLNPYYPPYKHLFHASQRTRCAYIGRFNQSGLCVEMSVNCRHHTDCVNEMQKL
jgi:hypothetical protein